MSKVICEAKLNTEIPAVNSEDTRQNVLDKSNQNKRVAAYAMVSSNNDEGESIDVQIRGCIEYVKRNGMIITDTYIDSSVKIVTFDIRPNFQRMISDAKQKKFDIVLVYKMDRFSRNRFDSAYYRKILKDNGIKVVSIIEKLDDNNSLDSAYLKELNESFEQYYAAVRSRMIRAAKKKAKKEAKKKAIM